MTARTSSASASAPRFDNRGPRGGISRRHIIWGASAVKGTWV
eukprot:CAMPEP_0115317424 /NCGR_PEP_ID=MMETSP0270-20121206/78654_1 /TAXON_ID=71861 /ORGANISM="Scrippsiella trochoidea, Strain CCMP3099" /LENGTH=41 /DNA_ID= /DNA_START= /DNA_END= /DNA_ORIENTATION=